MNDIRRRNDTNYNNNACAVKQLRKEYGGILATAAHNIHDEEDEEETYSSVRERLRKIDARQDDDACENDDDETYTSVMDRYKEIQQNSTSTPASSFRESTRSIETPTSTSTSAKFVHAHLRSTTTTSAQSKSKPQLSTSSATNMMNAKVYPPLDISFQHSGDAGDESCSSLKENSAAAKQEGFQYGNVLLKKVEKPVADRWKRKSGNESSIEAAAASSSASSAGAASYQDKIHTATTPSPKKVFPRTSPSPNHNHSNRKPAQWSNNNKRGKSLQIPPAFASAMKQQELSSSIRDEKYRTDVAKALKKVGRPVEGRWKASKHSEEDGSVSDGSKPAFATMKLRSVGTPTPTATDPTKTPNTTSSLKQKFDFDLDDKNSTLAKRRRGPPSTAELAQTSAICYGDHAHNRKTMGNSVIHKIPTEGSSEGGICVSDLAKTFSSQIKLASKGEGAEEETMIGRRQRVPSGANEITLIRSSLKSSAKELEELRKSLNSCTPVQKLIAERNKAALANRSEKNGGRINRSYRRPSASSAKSHRRSKSMSSVHTENSNGRSSVRLTVDNENAFKAFSEWENFKANNNNTSTADLGDIWNLNLDHSAFFGALGSTKSCTAINYFDDEISGYNKDKLLPSNSTLSEYTTDSDGDYDFDSYGNSRYIQITLSSGGIMEKIEPAVVMSSTEESSVGEGDLLSYQMEYSSDPDQTSESRHSRRKGLKGAKKFFFGKNKKKTTSVEV